MLEQCDVVHKPDESEIDENGYDKEGNCWHRGFDEICNYKFIVVENDLNTNLITQRHMVIDLNGDKQTFEKYKNDLQYLVIDTEQYLHLYNCEKYDGKKSALLHANKLLSEERERACNDEWSDDIERLCVLVCKPIIKLEMCDVTYQTDENDEEMCKENDDYNCDYKMVDENGNDVRCLNGRQTKL